MFEISKSYEIDNGIQLSWVIVDVNGVEGTITTWN